MGQVTVFSGPERRRRWSDDERLRILSGGAFRPALVWRGLPSGTMYRRHWFTRGGASCVRLATSRR